MDIRSFIRRVVFSIIGGTLGTIAVGMFLYVIISESTRVDPILKFIINNKELTKNLILGIGLLFTLLSFFMEILRFVLCFFAGGLLTLTGIATFCLIMIAGTHNLDNSFLSGIIFIILLFLGGIVAAIFIWLGYLVSDGGDDI
jgi:hypothetical protein